jgi:hypothetical protein
MNEQERERERETFYAKWPENGCACYQFAHLLLYMA